MKVASAACSAMIAGLAALYPAQAQQRDGQVEIGRIKTPAGSSMLFSLITRDGSRSAGLFVSDRHVIQTNLLLLTPADLKRMRTLIDQTLDEVEPGWRVVDGNPEAAAAAARIITEAGKACRKGDSVDLYCSAMVTGCGKKATDAASAQACLDAISK